MRRAMLCTGFRTLLALPFGPQSEAHGNGERDHERLGRHDIVEDKGEDRGELRTCGQTNGSEGQRHQGEPEKDAAAAGNNRQ